MKMIPGKAGRYKLRDQVQEINKELWPTPNASAVSSDLTVTCSGDGRTKPNKLGWAVKYQMFPTPRGRDWRSAKVSQEVFEKNSRPLNEVVLRLEPTPTGSMETTGDFEQAKFHSSQRPINSGLLNPRWVEWLMGFPIGWTDVKSGSNSKPSETQ